MTELTYTQIGDYLLPDLTIGESQPAYGKYGMLRKRYLKEHRRGIYASLLMSGKLNQHLAEIDKLVCDTVSFRVKEMAKRQGVDENMKAHNQMAWVGAMNIIKARPKRLHYWSMCIVEYVSGRSAETFV